MLILTRHLGQSIMIGDEVTVTILGTGGNQVRVGINAPKHIAVHREEVYERIHAEKLENVSNVGSGKLNGFKFTTASPGVTRKGSYENRGQQH